ncbi:prepilin-type N-terminal cleavage/methylation domain-containing protein [Patescibacteria group bacterium]|nr:prepilin-type N-terminal cleavage/methylation domain-containing protein [Patescibacteria group bacterium]
MTTLRNNKGFTIIELMIATTVLSILLLLSSMVLVNVGSLFSKGVNMSNVQNDARSIIQQVASDIQFSGSTLNDGGPTNAISYIYVDYGYPVTVYAYCFGDIRYSFVDASSWISIPGDFAPSNWPHELWRDKMTGQDSCSPLNIGESNPTCDGNTTCLSSQGGSELTGDNMHLATFNIVAYNAQLYGIFVGLVFGKSYMFVPNSSGNPAVVNGDYQCNTAQGQQYCATSYLHTLADERLVAQ